VTEGFRESKNGGIGAFGRVAKRAGPILKKADRERIIGQGERFDN